MYRPLFGLALLWIATQVMQVPEARASEAPHVATAFYYGTNLPPELLDHFDRVVVEPDNLPVLPTDVRAQVFAYVAVGEVNRSRPYRADLPPGVVIGTNAAWGSDVVDVRSDGWRDFLLARVVEPLWQRGFRGIFLDALDSYEGSAAGRDAAGRAQCARGVARIVEAIRALHPDLKLLMNRGFEVLPLLSAPPDGLVVESLFHTSDPTGHDYRDVPAAERDALLRALAAVRARWNLPIAVVDYVGPADREARRADATRILRAGFDPYVTTPGLDTIGVGRAEIVPRRVLLLYRNHPEEGYLGQQDACVLLAPVLEWMGFAVDYADVGDGLPGGDLAGRYAGIVTLLPEGIDEPAAYERWLRRQIDAGLRVAFVDGFGFEPGDLFLAHLGLAAAPATATSPVEIASSSEYVGLEAPAVARANELPPVVARSASVQSLLRERDAAGGEWDGVVIGRWGGAAFAPFVLSEGMRHERRWILDPFRFLQDALALPRIPAPDVTTESGRRILTIHVDGDAFMSHAERRGTPYAAEVILDEFLKRYPVPHTVSVVEGEVGPAGLYAGESPQLEAIARAIFRLPYVEIGSHTFSHPFDWAAAEAGRKTTPPATLVIPNYVFNLDREIRGSVQYIEKNLAPPGKRVKVLQWSGDCSPSGAAVELTAELGIENVNGGGATRTDDSPSLTRASAMGIPKSGGVYQVFAPIENEYVYTNDWHGPYYGYQRVIETFELNEQPRRLSTISIYYHFYSAVKTASVEALRRVYEWALAQETTRLAVSEYAAKVRAFQRASLARRVDDGGWELSGFGELRTVRVDPAWGWPDLERSTGVAGVRDVAQGRYVHLAGDADVVLYAQETAPDGPYLEQANGKVVHWERRAHGAALHLAGDEPLTFAVAGARACALRTARGTVNGAASRGGVAFSLPVRDTGEAILDCR
jgi:polysaccharide biosynthesis protein PelA